MDGADNRELSVEVLSRYDHLAHLLHNSCTLCSYVTQAHERNASSVVTYEEVMALHEACHAQTVAVDRLERYLAYQNKRLGGAW